MTEAPTIAERYQCATSSSDLRVIDHRRGDVDLLIAAGWAGGIGSDLHRLVGEYAIAAQEAKRIGSESDAMMVLGRLKSLTRTRVSLVRHAMEAAQKWRVEIDQNVISVLVGQCLSAFLEENCPRCNGTGWVGGYDGKPANTCRRCGGSGKARHTLGENTAQREFCVKLIGTMQAAAFDFEPASAKFLR
jgi:hypothetical protein